MTVNDTIRKLSDHQIMGMVEVMLSDDHRPDDATATYVAAYKEAMSRPSTRDVIRVMYPNAPEVL